MSDDRAGPFQVFKGALSVRLKVTPKASRNGVRGLKDTPGGPALDVSVTAAPEGGKANRAVIKLLAAEWKMAKGDIEVVSGTASRDKIVSVAGDPARVSAHLGAWLEALND